MLIKIARYKKTDKSTLGNIFIDGAFQCYSLERAINDPVHKAIPEGTYDMEWYDSPHNHLVVPLLKNVPGRSMIEIHPANLPQELEGCIAPGQSVGEDTVFQSRNAWAALVGLMHQASDKIQIQVTSL